MRNIALSLLVGTFLLFSFINLVSALYYTPSSEFGMTLYDFQINPNLTISQMVKLCIQESCIIDGKEYYNPAGFISERIKTITIQSHYDKRVALIFEYHARFVSGVEENSYLTMTISLPYDFDEEMDCEFMEGVGYINCQARTTTISPTEYDWKTSIKSDLEHLKELKVIAISDEEIDSISSLSSASKSIQKLNGNWVQVGITCVAINITEEMNRMGYESFEEYSGHIHHNPEDLEKGWYETCPTAGIGGEKISTIVLPQKEYGIQEDVITNNQEDKTNSSTLIYWIIGAAILIAAIILILIFRKKKN
ncbi:hypothetical protein A3K73_00315 [Candidatus Pacearchaeota archaeon RBG_13_36_9]|nr:MAG: hypothetical protein A3K73_00315 [Candidatus Pacearchaeota archaeon RBG_13_36_9]